MGRLFLVRHGQTIYNDEGRLAGKTDVPLNENGISQAHRLTEFLRPILFHSAFISPMIRAVKTAEIILDGRENIKTQQLAAITEMDFGDWEGKKFKELIKEHPEQIQEWINATDNFCFPGGECIANFKARILEAFDHTILPACKSGSVLMVTHGGVILTITIHLLGLPMSHFFKMRTDNARVTAFDFDEVLGARLVTFNAGPDLPGFAKILPDER